MLAHSHSWTRLGSTPIENLSNAAWELDHAEVIHPRESLDFLCVADLNTWTRTRMPYIPPAAAASHRQATADQKARGFCMTAFVLSDRDKSPAPVAVFIANLIERPSYADPTLTLFADGLRLTDTWGAGSGPQRLWNLVDVFEERVRDALPTLGFGAGGRDCSTVYSA